MGCDIHGPEIWGHRVLSNGRHWTDHIATLDWQRDYTCFGVVAGVRDDTVVPVDEPRGFPPREWFDGTYHYKRFSGDPDEYTKQDCEGWHVHYYGSDCHSATWLNTTELAIAQRRYVDATGKPSNDIAMAMMIMRTAESQGFEDVRLLCCFDN